MTRHSPTGGLEERLAGAVGGNRRVLAGGTVTSESSATAVVGADPDSDFEIGSISKALTGLLYADAVSTGAIEPSSRLGELLDVGDGPVASIVVSDLATHHSGLPRLPAGMSATQRTWDLWRHGSNPYGDTLVDLLAQAAGTRVGRRRFRYSNLGFELLGHAVAAAHGTSYRDLLRTRLTAPLGLDDTYAAYGVADIRPTALPGRSGRGRVRDPWTGEALAPAGGIRATVEDLTVLLKALLDGSAPGIGALDPVARVAGRARIGAAWLSVPRRSGTLTWHNGRTGGFASWIGVDRERGVGAVVLSATSRSVDRVGVGLLDSLDGS
jgi:CubicO group peptidase (beta-lactamase class C family)